MPPEQLEPFSLPAPSSFALLSAEDGPYRTLVEALDYGVLLCDPTATVLVHNAAAERILGLSAVELTGRAPLPPNWALFHEDGSRLTPVTQPVIEAFRTGQVLPDLVLRVRHRDGHTSWLRTTVQPLFAEGLPHAAVASIFDTTAQRQADRQLERHARFRTRLNHLVEASLQDDLGVTFYQRLMEGAVDAIPGAQAGSLLLRGDDDRFYFVAAVNFDQEVLAHTYLSEHELFRDPQITGPQLIYGFDNSGILELERRNLLYEAGNTGGIKVSLSIPVEVGGQVIAYFNLDNFDTPDAFSEGATEMGQLFARQTAVLWRRFRLEAELREERNTLKHMAFFDPLTGLPNRTLLSNRLGQVLSQSSRSATPVALIFLDLDNFKRVNDALGHDLGDTLLRAVAERLRACVRTADTVARWGGDEFVVLLPHTEAEDAAQVARKILSALGTPFELAGRELYSGASLGLSVFPEPARNADELIKHADIALYRVKEVGKGGFGFFSHEMNWRLRSRLTLEAELRHTLSERSLELRYQPRVGLLDGEIESLAAQAFWPHPQRGPVATSAFLPLISDTGLIFELCEGVLRLVCQQLLALEGLGVPKRIAVGLPLELVRTVPELMAQIVQRYRAAPRGLELSLYGSVSPTDADVQVLRQLHTLGVALSFQNLGGLTSFGLLRDLPLQGLGIDPRTVAELGENSDPLSSSLVQATVLLGRTLGARVFAQGVSTEGQRRALKRLGCTEAQGPLFGEPLSVEAVTALLKNRHLPQQG